MRDSTIIYRSFYEAIIDLPKENQAEVWLAIFEYSFNFNEIALTGISATVFKLIKPQLDANIKRYKSGIEPKNKRNRSEMEAKVKQNRSETEANENVNVNDNKNVNETHNVFALKILSQQGELDKEAIEISTKVQVTEQLLREFNANLTNQNKHYSHFSEYKKHLVNWIPKKPKQENTNKRNNKPTAMDYLEINRLANLDIQDDE